MKGWQELKKNRKKGVSMAVVVCISAFFVAFSVAMVYTAGLLTAQANSKIEQEQSYRLAKSFSEVLEREVKKYDEKTYDNTFYGFLNTFLDNRNKRYLEYNPEKTEKTTYYYQLESESYKEKYGNIKVALRKEKNEDEKSNNEMEGELEIIPNGDYGEKVKEIKGKLFRQYIVTVDVTVGYEDNAYTYTTEYCREEQYKPTFYYKGTEIYWNGSKWLKGDASGNEQEIDSTDAVNKITYKLNKNDSTSCIFKNVQEEAQSD